MAAFKLVRVIQGGGKGWPSAHVAIDSYHTYPERAGGTEMCLTDDAEDFLELSQNIDELIEELENIRSEASSRIEAWRSAHKT